MQCTGCGSHNPTGARFCNQCAKPLSETACPACGFSSAAKTDFCPACGSALPEAASTPLGGGGERRQITVLFSDLVASTAMSRELDAEDFHEVLNAYQAICREVVAELDGYVAQYLGDGVMVYFGYPEAHDDDPQRATQAGLSIVERVKSLAGRLDVQLAATPRVRIGIHTGVVLMEHIGVGPERLALGEAPNLAARLQQLAEPDTVLISQATQRLVEGFFRVEPRDAAVVKGFEESIVIYRVLAPTGARTRVDAIGRQTTPLIARDEEASELARHWQSVVSTGSSHVVLISGEPGIGKSRLVQAFKNGLSGSYRLLECHCSSFHQNTALRPVAQALESVIEGLSAASSADRFERLQAHLDALGLGEAAALLAPVLSISVPKEISPPTLTPPVRRQRTMQSLLDWARALARQMPVVFVIEDAHWADPSTLEFLGIVVRETAKEPIMLLATHRTEFVSPWPSGSTSSISLQRLAPTAAAELIDRVANGRHLPAPVVDRIIDLADGVPLYLEEVTKSAIESGALRRMGERHKPGGASPENVLPASVRDSLMARLDRLRQCKPIAQLASTLGREFSYDVLHTVALVDELTLNTALDRLSEAGLMLSELRNGARIYRFKHALIQEAAYQSLLRRDRQQYHHRVASVLRDQFPEIAETQPDQVAQHHAKANLPELSATYFERAGKMAFDSQAYVESINHFQNALEQTLKLPAHQHRDRRELEVLSGLGLPLLMTKGYAAEEVHSVYDRALTLCNEVDPPMRILYGIWTVQIVRGNRSGTERMAEQFAKIAEASEVPAERLMSLMVVGTYQFWRGAFDEAIGRLGEAVACFDQKMLATLPREYGLDNPLYAHLMLSWAQYLAGRVGDGQATWDEVWSATEASRSPYLSAMALSFGAAVARDLGDADRALELSEKGIQIASTHQLLFWLALAQMQHGSAQCLRGGDDVGRGLAEIEQGLQLFRLIGASHPLAYYLCYLADAYHRAGEPEKGLAAVEEGLGLASKTVDRNCTPELLRLKGELLLLKGVPREVAEDCLREALDIARADGAGLWELRCATSLARAVGRRDDVSATRRALDGACQRIVGATPPVLRAAQKVRDQLGGGLPERAEASVE
jgi:class 3 adenylate cyclase/tetratricopeptide (TPR) repeat protein